MGLENPSLIYEGPYAPYLSKPRAPLVFLHDGGGTTFSYHCLDPVGRPLWGIQNAKLDEGGWWEGGIPEMAACYVDMVEKAIPEGGEILLGGWSLGGLLSLEMASQFSRRHRRSSSNFSPDAPRFKVIGMVFVDSVYPLRLGELRQIHPGTEPISKTPEELQGMKLKEKVDLNMTHARIMLLNWQMPTWGRGEGEDRQEEVEVPPTILLRAKELVSTNKTHAVDYVRDFKMLGWDEYSEAHGGFMKKVVDVEGHHFSIFEFRNIATITAQITAAADELDPPEF